MKTATESIRDLENIIADLRNQLSDAGKRTDRLREERDSKSLFLREARAELDKVRGERDEAKKTAKLEMIAKLKRWIGPVGNPDYYKAQAQLLELESRASSLEAALRMLYEETAEYIRINNLGDVHHNRSMQVARDALSSPASDGSGTNYVADDEIYPTYVEFANGRVVSVDAENGRVFLRVGMKEKP